MSKQQRMAFGETDKRINGWLINSYLELDGVSPMQADKGTKWLYKNKFLKVHHTPPQSEAVREVTHRHPTGGRCVVYFSGSKF